MNKYYRHSPEERVEFLKAILNETGVTSIDLLASHSSGTFVSTSFWRDTNVPAPVKSLAMFNPIGCEHVVPMQPYWVMSGFTKAWQTKAGRAALERLGVPLMNRMGNPFAKNSLEDIVWGTFCLHYNDQAKVRYMRVLYLTVVITEFLHCIHSSSRELLKRLPNKRCPCSWSLRTTTR